MDTANTVILPIQLYYWTSTIDRLPVQKINKNITDLSYTVKQIEITDTCRTFYSTATECSRNIFKTRTYAKEQISLRKFKKVKIIYRFRGQRNEARN